jgi:hypothetical protein
LKGSHSFEEVAEHALDIIRNDPDVIVGIDEKLPELLCVLEILYGDLERFDWDPTHHAHHSSIQYNATAESLEIYEKYKEERNIWAPKNQEDIYLYKQAMCVFNRQFKQALKLLDSLPSSFKNYAPHCKPFI